MARRLALAGALWTVSIVLGLAVGLRTGAESGRVTDAHPDATVRADLVAAIQSPRLSAQVPRCGPCFGIILRQNTVVFLMVLAGAVTGGILTVTTLAYNGLAFGLALAAASSVGLSPAALFPAIAPHAFLESAAFTLAGAVGLGGAAVFLPPHRRSRGLALPSPATAIAAVVLGGMLLAAGAAAEAWISFSSLPGGGV